ncbi:hypothetical protein NC653_011040 [Populus alba x Populus x berolinensis]|uniref:Uncharacterized protein n=1 Tax=Populus alba x Populus x berolinensis TaxID=444605 RepID=A0AAD6W5U5_9ROSI|nr:hypothetical protein NC653_011040 [Populus alba x Populus x berolinensis]
MCCCKALQEELKEQTKDVDTAPSKEVSLYVLVWHGRECTRNGHLRWLESRGVLIFHEVRNNMNALGGWRVAIVFKK